MSSSARESHTDTTRQDYEGDFEKSLLSSTPKRSGTLSADASVRSDTSLHTRTRKTASVTSEPDNSTIYKSEPEGLNEQPETEWERWILRKAKELSFCQEKEKEKRKEERKKRKEQKRAKRDKLKEQERVIEDWKAKKLEEHKKRLEEELKKQRELEKKKIAEKEEILEKSILAVKEWKQKKIEKLKDSKTKKMAEEEKLAQLKEERRAKAKLKYEEWLKSHQPSPTNKASNRPKTLSDIYCSPSNKTGQEPWVNDTAISYEKVKVLYTPFL